MKNLDALTIGEAKQLVAMLGGQNTQSNCVTGHWKIGENYLLLVAGTFYTGKLVAIDQHEIVLEDAAWVADTGRFAEALSSGSIAEVEPCPKGEALLGRGALIAAFPWTHELPRKVK